MKDILITVCEGNVLELSTTPLILKRNESYRVVFDLTGWDGTRPVCRFRDAAGHYTDKELDSDNSCVVPALSTAITYIGLYSYDNLHSSTLVRLDALESILSDVGGASELLTNEEIETLKGLAATDFSGVLSLEDTVDTLETALDALDRTTALKTELDNYVLVINLPSAIETYVTENKDTLKGDKGERGYSAFEIAQQADGTITDVSEWLASLKGEKGTDGSSVTVQIDDSIDGQCSILFTDKTGDHTVTIYDGNDGTNGSNGIPGENGVSPTIDIDDTVQGQHTVTITDVDGDHDFTVYDGNDGTNGETPIKGIDYFTGAEIAEIESTVLTNVIMLFESEVLNGEY